MYSQLLKIEYKQDGRKNNNKNCTNNNMKTNIIDPVPIALQKLNLIFLIRTQFHSYHLFSFSDKEYEKQISYIACLRSHS